MSVNLKQHVYISKQILYRTDRFFIIVMIRLRVTVAHWESQWQDVLLFCFYQRGHPRCSSALGLMMGEPLHNSQAFYRDKSVCVQFRLSLSFEIIVALQTHQAMQWNTIVHSWSIKISLSFFLSHSLQGLNSFPLGGVRTHPSWAKPGLALPCPTQPNPALPNAGLNTPV